MQQEKARVERMQQERLKQEMEKERQTQEVWDSKQEQEKEKLALKPELKPLDKNNMVVEKEEPVHQKKLSLSSGFSLSLGPITSKPATTTAAAKPAIFSADAEDSEDMSIRKKRKLMVLEHEVAKHDHQPKEEEPAVDAKARAQAVIDKIPTDKVGLFGYTIDWNVVDEHQIVETKMKIWVQKKIVEYLGEEEMTLIEYICKKLKEHTPPDQILELLSLVLEEEASDFVIRMWRMLIYNILMVGHLDESK